MSGLKTLPAGWVGNDSDHHADVGNLRIRVYRKPVGRSVGSLRAYNHSRTGPHFWTVTLDGRPLHASATTGHADASEARREAILAARVVAREVLRACDWLDRAPVLPPLPEVQWITNSNGEHIAKEQA